MEISKILVDQQNLKNIFTVDSPSQADAAEAKEIQKENAVAQEIYKIVDSQDEEAVLLDNGVDNILSEGALGDKIRANTTATVSGADAADVIKTPVTTTQTATTTTTKTDSGDRRVYNADGSYTITKKDGNKTTKVTYDANGKKQSAESIKDGVTTKSTYKYNDDGTYTVTSKSSAGKTTVSKYNAQGKKVSAESKDKDGTVKESTYKYNSDGSYSVTTKNKKSGGQTVTKYSSNGKKESSVHKKNVNGKMKKSSATTYTYDANGNVSSEKTKNTKGKTIKSTSYKYNSDGAMTSKVTKENSSSKTTSVSYKYNTDGSYQKATKTQKRGKTTNKSTEKFNSEGEKVAGSSKTYNSSGQVIKSTSMKVTETKK